MKYLTKEVMLDWITALRSGRYQQGKGYLRSNNEYCCLGVLCEVLPPDAGEWKLHPSTHDIFIFTHVVSDVSDFLVASGRAASDVYLDGDVKREFNQLFSQSAVRKVFLDQLNASPWKSVNLNDVTTLYQHELGVLNDLGKSPTADAHNNPEKLSPLPFAVLADWLEATVAVADFSTDPT
jgi:hypothetical protein